MIKHDGKKDKIAKINEFLQNELWMDFEMCNIGCGDVELYGFIDEAGDNKIKIVFKETYMIGCTMCFTYEGEGVFISILTGKEAIDINKNYNVVIGNNIYKISGTNIETDMFVIAKDIDFIIF